MKLSARRGSPHIDTALAVQTTYRRSVMHLETTKRPFILDPNLGYFLPDFSESFSLSGRNCAAQYEVSVVMVNDISLRVYRYEFTAAAVDKSIVFHTALRFD